MSPPPMQAIREGNLVERILKRVDESNEIGVLVPEVSTGRCRPRLIVTEMVGSAGSLPVPIARDPSEISKERLKSIA